MRRSAVTVDSFVRLGVTEKCVALRQRTCLVDMIRAGAADEDWRVRVAAVGNPGAPEDVVRDGASDEDSFVRAAAVGNPGAPAEVIRTGRGIGAGSCGGRPSGARALRPR